MKPQLTEESGFRFYSFGIVVEDKMDDGDFIKVTPIEELPLVLGSLNDANFDYDVQGKDHRGVDVMSNIKGVSYVAAQWAPISESNRTTAPNVYKSETVLLLKYANTDNIYWCDFLREPKLRKLENAIYSYSNIKEAGQTYDLDTAYWFQVSTRDQRIRLNTSNNRDEPVGYDILIDTAQGQLTIQDTNKNVLFWDSVNGDLKITMQNSIEFDAPMIRINGSSYVRTTGPEITETGDHITNKANNSIKYNSSGTWDADSGGTINLHKEVIGDADAIFAGISSDHHTHNYRPGNGGPTPSSQPNG